MTTATHEETLGFQTEVKQLLNLMIHSLYSNREIFLRELISNAADACDKLRYAALDNDALYEGDSELRIEIEHDRDANDQGPGHRGAPAKPAKWGRPPRWPGGNGLVQLAEASRLRLGSVGRRPGRL